MLQIGVFFRLSIPMQKHLAKPVFLWQSACLKQWAFTSDNAGSFTHENDCTPTGSTMISSHFLTQKHSTKGNVKKKEKKKRKKSQHNTDYATILMMLVFLVFSSSCPSVTQDICTKEKSWNVNNKTNNNKTKQFSVSYFTVLTHAAFKKISQSLQSFFNHSDQHFLKMNKTHKVSLKTKSNKIRPFFYILVFLLKAPSISSGKRKMTNQQALWLHHFTQCTKQ